MDTLEAILSRRSVRKYKPDPIADEDLAQILEAGRQAPSGGNRQPWHFIVVRDPEVRQAVATACNKQTWMADADVIICACGSPEASKWHQVDPTIALQNMILAATALGYGTCWIGAMVEEEVRAILEIPPELQIVCLTPVGVPDEAPDARARKPLGEVFSRDKYGTAWE
jgi:nitroreductase